MEHTIRSSYDFSDKVYFDGHDDPDGGFVTGFISLPGYGLKIVVQWGPGQEHAHYEWELTKLSPDDKMSRTGDDYDVC